MNKANTVQIHEHGFIKLLNVAGPVRRTHDTIFKDGSATECIVVPRSFDADDRDPAQAARMSFDQFGSDRTIEQDMGLANYLMRNGHTSPFEMIQVWLEVKVPIFIDRQMVRHRTWKRNESSGRYIVLPEEWYIPKVVGGKSPDKKQGQEDNLPEEVQEWFRRSLGAICACDYKLYQSAINKGVAPEHARMFLHVNHYVHWIGSVDLANLFKFLALRTHDHAQIEAREYGEGIVSLLRPHLPELMKLFDTIVRK